MILSTFKDNDPLFIETPASVGYNEYMLKRKEIEELSNKKTQKIIPKKEEMDVDVELNVKTPSLVKPSSPLHAKSAQIPIVEEKQIKIQERHSSSDELHPPLPSKQGWEGVIEPVSESLSPPVLPKKAKEIKPRVKKIEEIETQDIPSKAVDESAIPSNIEDKSLPPLPPKELELESTNQFKSSDNFELQVPNNDIDASKEEIQTETLEPLPIASKDLKPIQTNLFFQ